MQLLTCSYASNAFTLKPAHLRNRPPRPVRRPLGPSHGPGPHQAPKTKPIRGHEACSSALHATTSALDLRPAPHRPYVSPQRNLLPGGDPACCTSSGHLKAGLSLAQAQTCSASGFTSDDACTVPEPCLEICGPRCKAFKAALRGFSYNIHWRAR